MTRNGFVKMLRYFVFAMALFCCGAQTCFGQQVVASGSNTLSLWSNPYIGNPNLLVNSEFYGDAHPLQTASTQGRPDTYYSVDMWKGYTSVATPAGYYNYIAPKTDNLTGAFNFIGMNHATTASQQTALVQFVEGSVTSALQGSAVSLSFNAESLAQHIPVGGITGGVLCWTGTANSPSKPLPGSSWGAVPVWSSSWSLLANTVNTGAMGTTWGYYKIENISVPTSCTNLAVIFWTSGTSEAAGIEYHLANIKLEQGATATTYKPDAPSFALTKLNRYVVAYRNMTGYSDAARLYFILPLTNAMLCAAPVASQTGAGTSWFDYVNPGTVTSTSAISSSYSNQWGSNAYNIITTTATTAGNTLYLIQPGGQYSNYLLFSCEP